VRTRAVDDGSGAAIHAAMDIAAQRETEEQSLRLWRELGATVDNELFGVLRRLDHPRERAGAARARFSGHDAHGRKITANRGKACAYTANIAPRRGWLTTGASAAQAACPRPAS
jgi:hypothetical protein